MKRQITKIPPIEDPSLSQLLGYFKPGRLWGGIAVVFGMISGAFGLGYKMSDYSNSLETNRLEATVSDLTLKQGELQSRLNAATIRKDFVANYQRYLLAADKAESLPIEENKAEAERAKKILVDQIYAWWQQQKNSNIPAMQRIAKGLESQDSRLVIMNGQSPESIWVIPPEIKYEVIHR